MLKTTFIPENGGRRRSIRHPQRYPATKSVWRSMRWHVSACEWSSEASLDESTWRCFSLMYEELRHAKGLPGNIWLNRLHPSSCDCDYRFRWRLRFSITPGLLSPQSHLLPPWGSRHMNTYRHTLVTSLLANAAACRSDICICLRVERISGCWCR